MGLIRSATRRLTLYEQIERSVLSGDQLLWIVWDGSAIKAAATTHLSEGVCTITSCGGSGLSSWIKFFRNIQQYASDESCSLRIQGRRGWARALQKNGVDVSRVAFEERT